MMKFQKYLSNTCIAEWRLAYFDYKGFKKNIKSFEDRQDDLFIRQLQIQLQKIRTFYHEQCATLPGRLAYIDSILMQDFELSHGQSRNSDDNGQHEVDIDTLRLQTINNNMKDIKHSKFLLKEYYRYCMFLENYQTLNQIAFSKIIKKYDKMFNANIKMRFCETFINDTIFLDTTPKEYSERAHDRMTVIFEYILKYNPKSLKLVGRTTSSYKNPKSLAMIYLRGNERKSDDFAFFRVGLYIGISLTLIVFSLIQYINHQDTYKDQVWTHLFHIFGGMFIIVLSFFGFSCDLYVWKYYRINYVFIFEFDSARNLTYKQFTEFSALSLFLWSICLYFTLLQTLDTYVKFYNYPIILIALYVSILFMPMKIFYWNSRKWFIKRLFHIFTPGFRKVTFRDFFIADLMISLTFFWTSLYLTACFYMASNYATCNPRTSWFTPSLISIPLTIRLLQCFRRMYDHKTMKHSNVSSYALFSIRDFWNSLKYMIAITSVFASAWSNFGPTIYSITLWVVVATISALYSYYWDISRDWNVFAKDKIIPRRYIRLAVVLNLILRFNWILTISAFLIVNQLALSFIFGCLEICRRYVWAIFRMELEHTTNMERFRAIKDIPLLE